MIFLLTFPGAWRLRFWAGREHDGDFRDSFQEQVCILHWTMPGFKDKNNKKKNLISVDRATILLISGTDQSDANEKAVVGVSCKFIKEVGRMPVGGRDSLSSGSLALEDRSWGFPRWVLGPLGSYAKSEQQVWE